MSRNPGRYRRDALFAGGTFTKEGPAMGLPLPGQVLQVFIRREG